MALEDSRGETAGSLDMPARADVPTDTVPRCGGCPPLTVCGDAGKCVPPPCSTSKDCPGNLVCAANLGICVACTGPEDCDEGLFCGADHGCHKIYECSSDKDCKDYDMVCDKTAGACVECLGAEACEADEVCVEGFCLALVCPVGATKCVVDTVMSCPDGMGWIPEDTCTPGAQYCEEGACVDLVCLPDKVWCEGEVYKVCAADGKSVQYEEDCGATNKHCFGGACHDTVCPPNKVFCEDGDTAATCAADGMDYATSDCPGQHYCAADTGKCQPWLCEPSSQACQGATALTCDLMGSAYASETDCASLGKTCQEGQCVACAPQCSGKECGDDGCGGSCGTCAEDENCVGGACLAPCTPSCDPMLEECVLAANGGWVCSAKMVEVPAGNFWMGCNSCEGSTVNDTSCGSDEHPYHEVYLDAYDIDQTEVTAVQYHACKIGGGCSAAGSGNSATYDVPGKEDHPVNYVQWSQAETYCLWVGKELCTEAQWEKGARGGCDENGGLSNCKAQSRMYPWGNETPTCDLVVKSGCGGGDTLSVCSVSPAGDSPYGLCDMAGNVWEWTADWYQKDYYCDGDGANGDQYCTECGSWPGSPNVWSTPSGTIDGSGRGTRGGSFYDNYVQYLRASQRNSYDPSTVHPFIGVRCCRSVEP